MITQHLLNARRNFKRNFVGSKERTLTLMTLRICTLVWWGVWWGGPSQGSCHECVSCRKPLGSRHGRLCCLVCDGDRAAVCCSREALPPSAVQVSPAQIFTSPASVLAFNRLLRPPSFLQMFLWVLMGLVQLLVCMSRVFMAAHFPHQVIAGLLSGLCAPREENCSVDERRLILGDLLWLRIRGSCG